MEDLLRSKGLYPITLGKEEESTNDDKYAKWINRNDKACGVIIISMSHDLRFHLQGLDAPNKDLGNLEAMFGKHIILFKLTNWRIN